MKSLGTRHLFWGLWAAGLLLLVTISCARVTGRLTRFVEVALFLGVWFGFIALLWRRRVLRCVGLAATTIVAAFLLLPSWHRPDPALLREDYVAALRHYEGVTYCWGGEGVRGIDCSGLVRRGMVDAAFRRGVRTCDPDLVRRALFLWWHDCAAWGLGWQQAGLTTYVRDTSSINALDHSGVLPGDLAVTLGGDHVMAYLGSNLWIQADPRAGSVTTTAVPSEDNTQFRRPMRIVRWSVLQ